MFIRGGKIMFILAATELCSNIPSELKQIISAIITLIKIAVPILLVIYGMLDLGKAVMSQKEDEIKKGQQTFLKRLVAAALVFLVIFITQFIINIIPKGDQGDGFWTCADEIINYDS